VREVGAPKEGELSEVLRVVKEELPEGGEGPEVGGEGGTHVGNVQAVQEAEGHAQVRGDGTAQAKGQLAVHARELHCAEVGEGHEEGSGRLRAQGVPAR